MKKTILALIIFSTLTISCSKQDKETSLLCLGDILTAKAVEKRIITNGIEYPFKKVKEKIDSFDLVFGNLETSISDRGQAIEDKAFTFRMSPKAADSLKQIKLNIVSLANNHLLDFGEDAMFDTFKFLKKNNILYSGAGENLKKARKPVKISMKGTNYVFLSYCERPPVSYYATDKKGGTAPLNPKLIIEDIKKYKKSNNVVLISLHWGIERTATPRKDQIKTAHAIIDAGADGIIGHHPHVPQSIEIYKNKPILYSLGNFIIGYYNSGYRNNIAISFHYIKNRLQRLEILPVAGKNSEMEFQPFFLKEKRAKDEIIYLNKISKNFNTKIEFKDGKGTINFN